MQRRAVRELAAQGLPQRDVGRLLGVTHQRVAQIAKPKTQVKGSSGIAAKPG
jgi:transcriptional regulator with XRE-family HTH domain